MSLRITNVVLTLILVFIQSGQARVRFGLSAPFVEVNDSNAHYLTYVRHMTVPFANQTGSAWDAGNDTSGKTPAEVQAIVNAIKALEEDLRQKEIYTQMKATPIEWFTFRDILHAKGIVLQRLDTVVMMNTFNADHRYWYHGVNTPVSTTAANWALGTDVNFYFRQKSGTAYAAIDQLCHPNTRTYGECLGAMTACVWYGASRGMGETAFNGLYPGTQALNMDWKQGSSSVRNTVLATDKTIHVPGDWLYMKNHNYNDVINKTAYYKKGWLSGKTIYLLSGENALYVDQSLGYEGLDMEDQTESQMREQMRNAYNSQLSKVISGLKKSGGLDGALEVKAILLGPDAELKIKWTLVRRLVH